MQRILCFAVALVSGAILCAQDTAPPPAQTPAPAQPAKAAKTPPPVIEKEPVYVRRFSLGATLSVLGFTSIENNKGLNVVTETPAVDALYVTTDASQRIGYGVTAQLAVSQRWAVSASWLFRRIGYKMESDIYTGTDNPNTTADERTHTVIHEDTRARIYDIPVVLRFYNKARTDEGPRWFVEAGGVRRLVSHIRTSTDTTINDGDNVCCDTSHPATPAHRSLTGLVGGVGFQVIDPVGVRIVPEVRYTRWLGRTFDIHSTLTRLNQVEAMVSLTF
jgi:hypothetical protein